VLRPAAGRADPTVDPPIHQEANSSMSGTLHRPQAARHARRTLAAVLPLLVAAVAAAPPSQAAGPTASKTISSGSPTALINVVTGDLIDIRARLNTTDPNENGEGEPLVLAGPGFSATLPNYGQTTSYSFKATSVGTVTGQPVASSTVDGASADVAVSAEGTTTLTFSATDEAGNVETAQTKAVRIDRTAPEATLAFDPASRRIVVTGRDATAGVAAVTSATGPLGQTVVAVSDVAGNAVTVTLRRLASTSADSVRVTGLSYTDAAGTTAVTPGLNELGAVWQAGPDGRLTGLQQQAVVQAPAQGLVAVYRPATDTTSLVSASPPQTFMLAGMALLHVVTARGRLAIEH
jgi:hypothetical protein